MSINNIGPYKKSHLDICIKNNSIDDENYGVKRSLRDLNGIGINAGITNVSLSKSFTTDENGNRIPCAGELYYRGYEIHDLIKGFFLDNRIGFEESTYLMIYGI